MDVLMTASFALLLAYALIASIDALYLHLWRFRLHTHPETQREHLLHTARAVLFPLILVLLFSEPSQGPRLFAGVLVAAVDMGLLVADVWSEPASRARLGGLSAFESALHSVLITLHAASLALLLGSRLPAEWGAAPPVTAGAFGEAVVGGLLPGAWLIAIAHLWLAWWPARARAAAAARLNLGVAQ
jgi:hypothetical protein